MNNSTNLGNIAKTKHAGEVSSIYAYLHKVNVLCSVERRLPCLCQAYFREAVVSDHEVIKLSDFEYEEILITHEVF